MCECVCVCVCVCVSACVGARVCACRCKTVSFPDAEKLKSINVAQTQYRDSHSIYEYIPTVYLNDNEHEKKLVSDSQN